MTRRHRPPPTLPESFGATISVGTIIMGVRPYEMRNLVIAEPGGPPPRVDSRVVHGRRLVNLADILNCTHSSAGGKIS